MRTLFMLAVLATASLAQATTRCLAPGEPVHWRVDYCMMKMETDDEIPVSGCIDEQGKRRFASACASNMHFKKQMCRLAIRNATRAGSLSGCMKDTAFQGRTVRHGGVGG